MYSFNPLQTPPQHTINKVLVYTSVSQDAHRQHPLGGAIERKHGAMHRDFYRSEGVGVEYIYIEKDGLGWISKWGWSASRIRTPTPQPFPTKNKHSIFQETIYRPHGGGAIPGTATLLVKYLPLHLYPYLPLPPTLASLPSASAAVGAFFLPFFWVGSCLDGWPCLLFSPGCVGIKT